VNKRSLSGLGVIVLVAGMLGFFTLSRGHLWWDDFASYVMQAKSILSWSMSDFTLHNAFTVENSSYPPGPVAYPWGFPLLLAPVYALFGINPLALKLVSVFFYALFVVVFYLLARTRLAEADSLLLAGVFATLPAMVAANDLILSDIPFLAVSTLCLVLIERLSRGKTLAGLVSLSGLACGGAIFGAFFLRSNGVLLLAPLVVGVLVSQWPRWRDGLRMIAAPLFSFAILLVAQMAIFPGGQESYFSHFSLFTPARLLDNVLYYLWLPSWAFESIPGGVVIYPILGVFALVSMASHLRRDAALHAYGLLTVVLFIAWPERQGLRFIYPALPVLFIAALDGMQLAARRLKGNWQLRAQLAVRGLWGVVLAAGLAVSASSAYTITVGGREINGPFDPYSNQMFSFIREETPPQSIVIFMRPRAMRLFTDRDSFMTERCTDLSRGDYVVIHDKQAGNGQVPPEQVETCNPAARLERVFKNKRFTVYKVDR